MDWRYVFGEIGLTVPSFSDTLRNKIPLSEHFITYLFQVRCFVVIDGDEDNPVLA